MLLLAALLLALLCLAFTLGIFYRASKNVGPMTLEDYARRHGVVLVPVPANVVDAPEWSRPMRMRITNHDHPLLGTLIVEQLDGAA